MRLLVDRDIRKLLAHSHAEEELAAPYIENGIEECITNIGYDLRADHFMRDNKVLTECLLEPGESVFVSSKEIIGFDNSMIGRIVLKNSRIRMGLTMDAPMYQPGHITPIYFRLTNISQNEIKLEQAEKYVTLIFEQLDDDPEKPYDGTFQKEFSFQGLADYKSKYIDQIQSIKDQVRDLKSLEKNVYSNVITILTIFVAIFTILNVNISLVQQITSGWNILAYNIIILGAIGFLIALMDEVLHRENKKHCLWAVPIACLIVSAAIFLFS